MSRPLLACLLGLVLPLALLAQDGPDATRERAAAGTAKLYDTTVLHRIDLVIASEDVDRIPYRTLDRVRATLTIDGLTLKDVGVRQSGGIYHGYQPINGKPSLSLKFDEFTKDQRLFGLDKLILKNELQDFSFVSEHLSYEVFRRAGLAAPMTAHARVSINGIDNGIYLMREPVDKEFLRRNFGGAFDQGNLYEIENTRDFVFDPNYPPLNDEGEKGRNRADLVNFAAAIRSATPESVERNLAPFLDIDRFATYVAAEMATGHSDGLTYNNNNTYIYAHPKDGRFVFIPWGMDQAFRLSRGRFMGAFGMTFGGPRSYLVQQLFQSQRFVDRVNEEVTRIGQDPVWSPRVLLDRLNAVERTFATAELAGRTGSDISRFRSARALVETVIGPVGAP